MNTWRRLLSHLPRPTVRLRLSLLYGGMFLACGALLLVFTNVLVRRSTGDYLFAGDASGNSIVVRGGSGGIPALPTPLPGIGPVTAPAPDRGGLKAQSAQLIAQSVKQHSTEVHQLLVQSIIALAVMAVLSVGLGWLVAGRALRPLRTITAAARHISASNLHERLALTGPDDELKELADTFDALIARLERSFQSQRQFVANASHELRTPLTLQHALLEAALLDPASTSQSWRTACERALAASQEQERLIAALLTLARSDRGLSHREPLDLAVVTTAVLAGRQADVEERGLHLSATLEAAPSMGDPALAERLVANLIDNALRHNIAGGRVEVATEVRDGGAVLSVRNSGPRVDAAEVDRLFEPFQRADGERTSHDGGLGLGLSIVQAIATAHGATVSADAPQMGGLDVVVRFPPGADDGLHAAVVGQALS